MGENTANSPIYLSRRSQAHIFQLWPIHVNEFLPERTFEWNRYLYVIVHGRQYADGTYPNLLEGRYLNEIEMLERSIAENVTFPMRNEWRSNSTSSIKENVRFEVSASDTNNMHIFAWHLSNEAEFFFFLCFSFKAEIWKNSKVWKWTRTLVGDHRMGTARKTEKPDHPKSVWTDISRTSWDAVCEQQQCSLLYEWARTMKISVVTEAYNVFLQHKSGWR